MYMKRKICKKNHIGDYAELGTLVKFAIPHGNEKELLSKFQDIVEKHKLSAWGGNSQFILTPKVNGNYIIPTVIEQFIIGMMNVEDDNTMAFIVHKPGKNACQSAFAADVEAVFNEVKYQLKVFTNIDLWQIAKK